ncbi:Bug family tripartite tricarboxylate transporter substrate binding protein [Variovorax boronicumulans]
MKLLFWCRQAVLVLIGLAGQSAFAQESYPSRPVNIVVGFAAGGPTDSLARIVAHGLSQSLGQSFIVNNKAGAAGQIAASMVAKAPPDGYTLLLTADSHLVTAALRKNPSFDAINDFTFIRQLAQSHTALMVRSTSDIKNVAEYVARAKKEPGAVNFAISGDGTAPYLTGMLFSALTGITTTPVPYRSLGESLTATLAGNTTSLWGGIPSALPSLQRGELRALAVAGPRRSSLLPDVPTLEELGYKGVTGAPWFGLLGPANMPPAVVQRLDAAIKTLWAKPETIERIRTLNLKIVDVGPQAFKEEARQELEAYRGIVKKANLPLN